MLGPELFCRVLGIDAPAMFPWTKDQEKRLATGGGICMCCGRDDGETWLERGALPKTFTEYFLFRRPSGRLLCPWCVAALAALRTDKKGRGDPVVDRLRDLAAETLGRTNGFARMDFAVSEEAGVTGPRSGKQEDRLAFWAELPSRLAGKGRFAVAAFTSLSGAKSRNPKHRVPFLKTSLTPVRAHVVVQGSPPLSVDLEVVSVVAEMMSDRPWPWGTWTGCCSNGKKVDRKEERLVRRFLADLLDGRPAEERLVSSMLFAGAEFNPPAGEAMEKERMKEKEVS